MPGAFKLDHLQQIKTMLFLKISNFFTFILGGQFLLPQAERNKTIERQFSNAGTNFLTRDNLISLAERVMMMIFGRQFDFIG